MSAKSSTVQPIWRRTGGMYQVTQVIGSIHLLPEGKRSPRAAGVLIKKYGCHKLLLWHSNTIWFPLHQRDAACSHGVCFICSLIIQTLGQGNMEKMWWRGVEQRKVFRLAASTSLLSCTEVNHSKRSQTPENSGWVHRDGMVHVEGNWEILSWKRSEVAAERIVLLYRSCFHSQTPAERERANAFPNPQKGFGVMSPVRQTDNRCSPRSKRTHFISYHLHVDGPRGWQTGGHGVLTHQSDCHHQKIHVVSILASQRHRGRSCWHPVVTVPLWEMARLVTPVEFITQLLPDCTRLFILALLALTVL